MTTENNHTEPQENVIADFANELKQTEMAGYEHAVTKARNALFWTGGLLFFWEMVGMAREGLGFDPVVFIIGLIEAGIFIGLALWTKKKPYSAIVTGLTIFICIILFYVVANGMIEGSAGVLKALFSGIIIKVIILVNLIRPLKDAKALQEAMRQEF